MTHKHKYSIPSADDQNDARCIGCGQLKPPTHTATHTPGPWFYNYDDHCIVNQAGISVVNVHGAMGGNDTNADIALIAAAPAMYEALSSILKDIEKVEPRTLSGYANLCTMFRTVAKTALAQAEGKQ